MTGRIQVVPFVVCVVVLLAGCSSVPEGNLGGPTEAGLSPPPQIQEGTFNYSGSVELTGIGNGCVHDIEVVLYDSGATYIKSVSVGTLCFDNTSTKSTNVRINSTTQPKYIIIESPEFWNESPPASPGGYIRNPSNDIYDEYPIEEQGQIKPRGVHSNESNQGNIRTGWSVIGLVALTVTFGLPTIRRESTDD